MTKDAKLIAELRQWHEIENGRGSGMYIRKPELYKTAADRLAALSEEVAEYRQSLNKLGEHFDAKCEELENLRDSERFKVD